MNGMESAQCISSSLGHKYGQLPSSKSEPEEEKDQLIGNGGYILWDSEICIEFKATFCTVCDYSQWQSKLHKTLLPGRVLHR